MDASILVLWYGFSICSLDKSCIVRKPVFAVSAQVLHKSQSTAAADGYRHEGLYYLCREIKGTDPLYGYCAADLHLVHPDEKKQVFSYAAHIRDFYCDLKCIRQIQS